MTKNQQILVMSDSHGSTSSIVDILKHHANITDVFHCGDAELEYNHPALSTVHTVRGNCDSDHNLPSELVVPIGHYVIYITHGHLYGVKSSLHRLAEQAQQHNADIALYGHTHIARMDKIDGVECVNPGSIAYPRGNIGPSYCIITLNPTGIKVERYGLQHALILTETS